jgi:hypothetical protein
MYSQQLEKEILDKWSKTTEVIPKTLDDLLKAAETPFQITKEVCEVQTQFSKELEEKGIGIFSFRGKDSPENVAAQLVEFIERETGFTIEIACVKYGFYARVNKK